MLCRKDHLKAIGLYKGSGMVLLCCPGTRRVLSAGYRPKASEIVRDLTERRKGADNRRRSISKVDKGMYEKLASVWGEWECPVCTQVVLGRAWLAQPSPSGSY